MRLPQYAVTALSGSKPPNISAFGRMEGGEGPRMPGTGGRFDGEFTLHVLKMRTSR